MKAICSDGSIILCEGEMELSVLRHSAAHILAQAVKRLYPSIKLAYGSATEKGFYYDFDPGDFTMSDENLVKIEEEMRNIVRENLPVKLFSMEREDAVRLMEERGEWYKAEHIRELPPKESITFFRQGDYIDLCKEPYITYTKVLKAFRLTGVSGAYWKNDASNQMLTRIYGTALPTKEELDQFLLRQEEAARRDHRKIGREMGLFLFAEEGPGFPFFLPDGLILRNQLMDEWRRIHKKHGYLEISTPILLHQHLWETSGHWEHYRENMYTSQIDGELYCIKPMSCPGGIVVYRSQHHSYRDFPLRLGEMGLVHRHELRGALHGLFRVRCFTQDDAHIFLRRDQIEDEIIQIIRLIDEVYSRFGFSYALELSTRPDNSMGSDEDWEAATS